MMSSVWNARCWTPGPLFAFRNCKRKVTRKTKMKVQYFCNLSFADCSIWLCKGEQNGVCWRFIGIRTKDAENQSTARLGYNLFTNLCQSPGEYMPRKTLPYLVRRFIFFPNKLFKSKALYVPVHHVLVRRMSASNRGCERQLEWLQEKHSKWRDLCGKVQSLHL